MQIYKIINLINNKIYVGKDSCCNPDYFGSGININKAIKKYGKENFKKEILEDNIVDNNILNELEKFWIKELNATNRNIGYNIASGGDGGNTFLGKTEEEMKEIRNKLSKNNSKRIGEKSPMFGKKLSEDRKRKLKIGYDNMNDVSILRMKMGLLNAHETIRNTIRNEEHAKKIGIANRGKKRSKYVLEKMSKSQKGKHTGANNPMSKKVLCLETNEIFDCQAYGAEKIYGNKKYYRRVYKSIKENKCIFGFSWKYVI